MTQALGFGKNIGSKLFQRTIEIDRVLTRQKVTFALLTQPPLHKWNKTPISQASGMAIQKS